MDAFLTVVSLLLVLFLFIHVWATTLMGRVTTESKFKYPALNERFFTGVIQTTSSLGFAALGANRIFDWHLSEPTVLIILVISLLIKVTPSMYWLYLYYTDGFHIDGSHKE